MMITNCSYKKFTPKENNSTQGIFIDHSLYSGFVLSTVFLNGVWSLKE